jgi:AraC-like DNA-binding protein
MKRQYGFPLTVSKVYFCNGATFPSSGGPFVVNVFEVSLRLNSEAMLCQDQIDGKTVDLPFPHVVLKHPGKQCLLVGELPRDTIAFSYNMESYALLKAWKMIPEENFWPVNIDGILLELVEKFRQVCMQLTIAGAGDQLDGVCFQILRELLLAREQAGENECDAEVRIRKAAIYFQHHCNRSLTVEDVARRFGFSRAAFFREWKRIFPESPKEHILRARLEMAALRLIRSDQPVADIAGEVNFSGVTAFYSKFQKHFGVSPGEFRCNSKLWKKIEPDILPANEEI